MSTAGLVKIIDTVQAALIEQGGRSVSGSRCQYRGAGGRKCAVGHLIPDSEYTEEMEGYPIYRHMDNNSPQLQAVVKSIADRFGTSVGDTAVLLSRLQNIHDNVVYDDDVEKFKRSVDAGCNALKASVLEDGEI